MAEPPRLSLTGMFIEFRLLLFTNEVQLLCCAYEPSFYLSISRLYHPKSVEDREKCRQWLFW